MSFFQDYALPGRCWRHGERTLTQIFDSLQHRVDQCMHDSEAYRELSAEANQLWKAMEAAPITDTRHNFAGERHRLLVRAQALRAALEERDPTLRHVPWAAPLTQPHAKSSDPPCIQKAPEDNPVPNMEDDEVSPQCALLSACLLQSALFEGMAHSDTEIRRRVFADYTTLKRDFRHSPMRTLHGPTTSVGELFGSVKDLDKQGLCDNVQGIVFDDWTVHRRVDAFLRSDLGCEATCLTQEGPIGRIRCRLRSFLVLAVLQERLLRDLFATRFCASPVRGCEPMTLDDPLDYYDFLEAMTRNTPNAYASSRGLYFAWLYAPEVNATPAHWEQIFGGPGANRLPCLYDGITTPDDAVVADPKSDSGYSLELPVAAQHEYEHAGAQAAVGYPWADDFLGAYIKKLRQAKQAQAAASPAGCSGDEEQSVGSLANNEGMLLDAEARCGAAAGSRSGQAGCKDEPGSSGSEQPPAKRAKCEAPATVAGPGAGVAVGVKQEAEERGAAAGPGPSSEAAAAAAAAAGGKAAGCKAGAGAEAGSSKSQPAWDDRERLPLPLGIFLVGIITSSAFTNTQIHIEDLMLMSININIFGCPKIWWWIPRDNVPRFKRFAESISGRQDLYTKAVAPFIMDRGVLPHEHKLPLSKLKEFGARRVIQMPGMAILTSPGYAFHFTVSMGLNVAESCNMFLEMMGWTVERLWKERPMEQYPDPENSMAKWMHEHGVLDALGLQEDTLHAGPEDRREEEDDEDIEEEDEEGDEEDYDEDEFSED